MNDTKSCAKFFCCIKCVEIFEADHILCGNEVLKLQSLLRSQNVSV